MIPVTASAKRWLVIEFLMKSCHGIEGHFDAVAFALAGICVGWHLRWLAFALAGECAGNLGVDHRHLEMVLRFTGSLLEWNFENDWTGSLFFLRDRLLSRSAYGLIYRKCRHLRICDLN